MRSILHNPESARIVRRYWCFLILCLVAAATLVSCSSKKEVSSDDEARSLMTTGKNYYDKGETARAIDVFAKALALDATNPDAYLNLANAHLRAGQPDLAIQRAEEALKLDQNQAAAHFVIGSACLRLNRFEEALKALQIARDLDPTVAAVFFQIGVAHQHLKQFEDAANSFQTALDIDPEHPAAHYNLSQVLMQLERVDEAKEHLEAHQQRAAQATGAPPTAATYEKSRFTEIRVPFLLEQPALQGVPVRFSDVTAQAFPPVEDVDGKFNGPVGVLDVDHDGFYDLFVREGGDNFRLLMNSNGVFYPSGEPLPVDPEASYTKILVGDLQHDRAEDLIALSPQAMHVFRVSTNGTVMENTPFTRLAGLKAVDGALVDLDFTGKLDLLAVTASNTVEVFRNLGNFTFRSSTATSGVPANLNIARNILIDDWNNDDLMDVFVGRAGEPQLVLLKQRGGPLVPTNAIPNAPNGVVFTLGDLNNDLRTDLIVATGTNLEVVLNGLDQRRVIPAGSSEITHISLVDYDNDGWLDILTLGGGVRLWRNLGNAGFREVTQETGLAQITDAVIGVSFADFDLDGDTDFLLVKSDGLQLLRNDGGNSNNQLKIRLLGNRSNASGLGIRVEVTVGGLKTIRTVRQLPIEIGVGKHQKLESVTLHWFDLAMNTVDVEVNPRVQLVQAEIILPTGSCPYLYAWDGKQFRFVTDLLGAAPLGLPVAEGVYIEADPEEYVWIGNESNFQPQGDEYVLQITEELREVLYLDEAKLIVVDHPPGTEIYPTDKLLPRRPFPTGELVTLHNPKRLREAVRNDGLDVTPALQEVDDQMASPVNLRPPQYRGAAEPYAFTLDFGPLDTGKPLVLGLTGWLRFGGGMANIAASHHPDFPFPFPQLEVETPSGEWHRVDVVAGAPAGKTKRMMIDLTGKLPPGSRRLRLSAAFEIHWDQALLFERAGEDRTRIASIAPSHTDLHWRGFSEFKDLPWSLPLTPEYGKVFPNPHWRITPSGWCTRYGEVGELVAKQDDALVLVNGGDELTLRFNAKALPEKPAGYVREFFLYTVGWDKDADFHVAEGTTVEPLPFRGMNDQLYGKEKRPVIDGDWWIPKYNTRWVAPFTLKRRPSAEDAASGGVSVSSR